MSWFTPKTRTPAEVLADVGKLTDDELVEFLKEVRRYGLMRAADLSLGGNRLLEVLEGKPANG